MSYNQNDKFVLRSHWGKIMVWLFWACGGRSSIRKRKWEQRWWDFRVPLYGVYMVCMTAAYCSYVSRIRIQSSDVKFISHHRQVELLLYDFGHLMSFATSFIGAIDTWIILNHFELVKAMRGMRLAQFHQQPQRAFATCFSHSVVSPRVEHMVSGICEHVCA